MPDNQQKNALFGTETARLLLEIKAVNFRPEEPYILTSGWASPVYIDCRKVISFPEARTRIMEMAAAVIEDAVSFDTIDAVAGGETAGIPYAAWIAHASSLPMLYVRKKPKGFGRNAQIEGDLSDGQRVLLVEDLTTDGASKITFVNALRAAGATVTDALVVFFYGVFPGAVETMKEAGIRLHYLADWWDVVEAAETGGYFDDAAIAGVREFLADPVAWSRSHGGKHD